MNFILNDCAVMYEERKFGLPREKYTMLKTMAFGLYLMDGSQSSKLNIYKSKSISLPRFDAIFAVSKYVGYARIVMITIMIQRFFMMPRITFIYSTIPICYLHTCM
jgi:hypothetical protein